MKYRLFLGQKGATLVEVLVAIALTGIILPVLALAMITAHDARPSSTQKLQATALLREATEALRSVREAGWSNIAAAGTYHPVVSGNGWALASGPESIGNFTRQIVISTAQRNGGGTLVSTGGTLDPSTMHAVASVSWSKPTNSSISSDMYLARWQNEAAWTQTTQADFTADALTNIDVTSTSGGETQLAAGQTNGSIESATFDATASAGFNYLSFTADTPAGTSIEFQIASNTDDATWDYVGPDGTATTFFTAPGAIPLAAAQGQYFRYKATLTGSGTDTPVLDDVTLTYSK